MEFITFIRKPFVVEAVLITKDNIKQIAPKVGTLEEENGEPFIQVNPKKVPNVYRVHPGFWMTKLKGTNQIRCYKPEIFQQQFVENSPEAEALIEQIKEGVSG